MGNWLVLLALFLLPFVATYLSLRRRKPLLGFALGALPLFLLWLALALRTELTLYQCSRDVTLMCELTALGIMIPTLLVIAILTLDGLALAVLAFTERGLLWPEQGLSQYQQDLRRPLWLSLLFITVVGPLALAMSHWIVMWHNGALTVYWLVPMLALVGTIAYVVNHERLSSPA